MRVTKLFSAGCALIASGCAIHPLTEDVTGLTSYEIVRQLRCEARQSVRTAFVKWMSSLNHPLPRQLAEKYQADPASIREFQPDLLKGRELRDVRAVAKLFYDTGIAYNFDLDMVENNDIDGSLDFVKPLTNGNFALGIKGGVQRKRENHRIFTVTDTFSKLLTKVPEGYCNGQIVEANYVYPISGRIGIDAVVSDFVSLTMLGNLSNKEAAPGQGGAPTMSDELTFTTKKSISVNPAVTFTPVGRVFQLTGASLTGSTDRTDIHKVTIGLAIATGQINDVDPIRYRLFSRSAGTAIVGRRVIGGGTPSEQLAVLAIDQAKSRELRLQPAP